MFKRSSIAVLVALLFFTVSQASAQIGIGPQIGRQKAQDADKARFVFGAALRLKLSSALGIEGSVGYHTTKYADGQISARSWPVMVTGLFYPLPILYGLAGGGWYNNTTKYELSELDTFRESNEQKFGWHFGGGVELPIGRSTKLVSDIRYVFINYDFETFPGVGDFNGDYYFINVGVMFGL